MTIIFKTDEQNKRQSQHYQQSTVALCQCSKDYQD